MMDSDRPFDDDERGGASDPTQRTKQNKTPEITTSSSSDAGRAHGTDSPLNEPPETVLPTPLFAQQNNSARSKWIPYPVRRIASSIATWARGPQPPRRYRIKPLFPKIQEFPIRMVERYQPKSKKLRFLLVFLYLAIWIVTFALVKRQGSVATDVAGYGQPQTISCGDTYWTSGNSCGLNGNDCRPFNGSGFAFRCPANCASYRVLNPRAVGDQEIIYSTFVIGGPKSDLQPELAAYRGDSHICGAAIHAGVVSNQDGGCGVIDLVGSQRNFISSQRNGITSIGFDSYFPLSFSFDTDVNCKAQDSRWSLLAVSTVFTGILSLLTTSPALFFFPTFIGIFATTGLAMDSPPQPSVAALVSNQLARFLPGMFCAWVIYDKMCVRRTLSGLTAQIEKTILWLGACWVGALDNYTLDFIPIQRLNKHDLEQQPGAKAALAIIVIVLFVIIVFQVWYFRQEGRFIKYIKLYALFVLAIVISLLLPGLNLRIHHFILALLLLPGTSLQTRPSLLYQGLLIGLFINGISRWGFGSFLETSAALRGDAQKGSLMPTIRPPVIQWQTTSVSNITFEWDSPAKLVYDGVSVLVNDVERYRAYFEDSYKLSHEFTWNRNSSVQLPEYFRFAFTVGSQTGDYTRAGIWTADGAWKQMQPGPSK